MCIYIYIYIYIYILRCIELSILSHSWVFFVYFFKCVLNFEFPFSLLNGQFLCYTRAYNCEGVRVCIHIFLRCIELSMLSFLFHFFFFSVHAFTTHLSRFLLPLLTYMPSHSFAEKNRLKAALGVSLGGDAVLIMHQTSLDGPVLQKYVSESVSHTFCLFLSIVFLQAGRRKDVWHQRRHVLAFVFENCFLQ